MTRSIQKVAIILAFVVSLQAAARADLLTPLTGHVPSKAISHAIHLGREESTDKIQMAVSLNLKNTDQLSDFLKRIYDPKDSLYHQYLTPDQFLAQYSPSQDDVNQVVSFLEAKGLSVTKIHSNNLIIDIEGSASSVENAFQIEMHDYVTHDGRVAHAPTSEPLISDQIASKMNAIVGLSSFSKWKTHLKKSATPVAHTADSAHASLSTYMTPTHIKSAYSLSAVPETGAGETIALFELDGYNANDITYYANYFSITKPTLKNVLVDGATGTPGDGIDEVTLDIELAAAIAPGASKIMVYEGPNTNAGVIDTYNQIATDNIANEVSTSWGEAENELESGAQTAENTIFQMMAADGQSVYAAGGDNAAYDDSENGVNSLQVDDPGSQPYVTSVGGTFLTLSGSNYGSEVSWQTTNYSGTYPGKTYVAAEGGGGGISTHWPLPSWQTGLSTAPNKGSTSYRMVPDVSLEADPANGYPIYVSSGWGLYGGTSCAAPLWAAFTSLANQKRVALNMPRLGFMNPLIYAIGGNAGNYAAAFHDIPAGTSNLFYPTETGYDLSTGWGSFNGLGLYNQLIALTLAPTAPNALAVTPLSLALAISWSAPGASSYAISRALSSGGSYTTLASSLSTNQYKDTGLTYGTTYYYKITATNGTGTSPSSAVVSGTPYPAPPTAPSNLTVTVIQ